MILTFYKIEENGLDNEKKYLQYYVSNHEIWKSIDYWKSCIYNSIINEAQNQKTYGVYENENETEKNLRIKNLVFGQLAAFGQNMSMFGLEKKSVFHIMNKFFDYYDLDEAQMESLKVFSILNKAIIFFLLESY